MRLTISLIAIFLLSYNLFSQVILKGYVSDDSGSSISYASVTLQERGTSVIASFTLTDAKGNFELKITNNVNIDNFTVNISSMGYEQKSIAISDLQKDNDVILKKQNINIEEVKIKAPKVRLKGDTITYTVLQFANEKDRSIADVLKKMPGVEVSKEGGISYQGKSINKFYIEGLDLLEDKYGIATTNIDFKDVSSVEIYENHQPIKALNGIISTDNAAINLKINESSKSVWIGNGTLGIGYSPILWNGSLAFMRFGAKTQSINTLKSNNTGEDIVSELNSLKLESYIKNRFKPTTEYFNISRNDIDINKERTSFNTSHSFSTSELWKLGKNLELKTQVLYGYDDLTFENDESIEYFTYNDTISFLKRETFNNIKNLLGTNLTLSINSEKIYLKNNTTGRLAWNSISSEILGTSPTLQQLDLPQGFLKNEFEILKRNEKHVLGLRLNTNYNNINHTLTASTDSAINKQSVGVSEFYNGIESSYSLSLGVLKFSITGGADIYSRNLNTLISGEVTESISLNNDSSYFKYMELYGSPELESSFKGLKIKIRAPYSFYYYYLSSPNIDNSLSEAKNLFSPEATIWYYITPKVYLTLQGGLNKLPLSYKEVFYGAILTDYMNITKGYTDFLYDEIQYSGLSLNYKNPLQMFFFSSDISITSYMSSTSTERSFSHGYILNSFKHELNKNNIYMINARLSKGFDMFNTLQSLEANYTKNNSAIIQDDVRYNYLLQNLNLSYDLSMRFFKILDIDYGLEYTLSNQTIEESSINSSFSSTKHDLSVYLTPIKSFNFIINSEYYSNLLFDGTKEGLYLFDIGCKYNYHKRWYLEFNLRNIFNCQYYTFNQSGAMSNSTIRYYLRPRQALLKFTFNI